MAMNILETPFMIKTNHEYPPNNKTIFEEYFYNWFLENKSLTNKTYLPIFWTNYYISKGYATQDISEINNFLDSIDKNKDYFTIVQWDDGIVNPFPYSNIYVFGQGGGGGKSSEELFNGTIGDYPIPLNCQSNPNIKTQNKDIFASFIGVIYGRNNWIREKLHDNLKNKNGYLFENSISYDAFSNVMSRSIFSLCPRGYGATSFRICEALQHESIPVYISDKPWIPFNDIINFNDYGVLIDSKDIEKIDEILKNISEEEIYKKLNLGKQIYNDYYSFEGCSNKIINKLNNL
jgi:hypothetical protein